MTYEDDLIYYRLFGRRFTRQYFNEHVRDAAIMDMLTRCVSRPANKLVEIRVRLERNERWWI